MRHLLSWRVREVPALADRSLDRLRPLLRLFAVREGLGPCRAPFYSHLRAVGNRVGQRTDDALNGSHKRLGARSAAVSKPTALSVHETRTTVKLAPPKRTQYANLFFSVGRVGIEPTTSGLKVRCSTD